MLEDPFVIGGAAIEMSNGLRKLMHFEGLPAALASNTHDADVRTAKIVPIAVGYRIHINLPQKRLREPSQLRQGLRINLKCCHTARFHRGGIERQCSLDLDAFRQKVSLEFPLNDRFPLFGCHRRRQADDDNDKHQVEIGHTSLILRTEGHLAGGFRAPGFEALLITARCIQGANLDRPMSRSPG